MSFRDAKLKPMGYQQITDLDPAVGLTVPDGAQYALIKAQTADARWSDDDAVTPSATVGMPLEVADEFWYTGELSAIRFFSATGGLNVSYYA